MISPDGRRIAYVVSRSVLERNTSVDELHVYDVRLRRDRRLALGHESFSNLMWSGENRLGYIADDNASDADQIFALDAQGRQRRITTGRTDVMDASWAPDGKGFAFVRRDAPPVRTGAASYLDGFAVGDNAYLATKAPVPAHLWLVDLNGRERRLTSGSDWSVRDDLPSWSSDGRSIVYAHADGVAYSLRDRSFVERVEVDSGARRALTPARRFEEGPLYAPDAASVAYLYPRDGDPANESEVFTVAAQGGEPRDISGALDRHSEGFAWYDSSRLLMRVYDHTRVRLVLGRTGRPGFADVSTGDVADASIEVQCAARDGALAFTGSTPLHPDELYYLPSAGASPQRLTNYNGAIAALDLARQTEIAYRAGGYTQYAVLTYPPGYDPRRKYPLLVRIHGGPNLSSFVAFDPFYQYAASRGYLVLAPNYRGSTNDGNAFQHAIFADPSVGPGNDVLAAIDAVVARNIVDPGRIGVSGWSYGGQMTTWLIGHDPRFKAAVAGAAVDDLVVDYATADDIDDDRNALGTSPFAPGALAQWRAASPLTYFEQITTPTLMFSNVYDVRVPIVESYELFHALRDRGVPVEFYAYPTSGHLPSGPVRTADVYRRWLDWFDRYVRR
ncbi:MAG TPA: prolyl oligopeptidase family serine peptidase [Candidatus Cybelea sp.]|nr:prolyl oligopeptidase family serine peptidase [Candidatus Cybelea sp.]